MSHENVEIVRASFEAWNAGDMDAFRAWISPDAIMRTPEGWPEPGPLVGREAVMRQIEQLRETWDVDALIPISDFIDAADRVVVRFIWRGAGHGPDADLEMTGVYTVRKGKVAFWEFFWDHAEALDTLGLSERAMSQENAEIVRRWIEAYNRRDMEALNRLNDHDFEFRSIFVGIESVFRGPEGLNAYFTALDDAYDYFLLVPSDFIDAGAAVLMVANVDWCGKGSGAQGETPIVAAFWLRAGKVFREETFTDRADALEAVGLSEQDAHADS